MLINYFEFNIYQFISKILIFQHNTIILKDKQCHKN